MKGLLLKDWYVGKKSCRLYAVIILLMAVLSPMINAGLWMLFYPIMFAGIIPVNILSVDERCGWNGYAQCLPYERRDIVTVKYVDSLITVGLTVLVMTLAWLAKFLVVGGGMGLGALIRSMAILFCAGLLFPMLMLPAMLRFGVEKGRYIMMAGVGVAVALVVTLSGLQSGAPQGMQTKYAMDIAVRAGWRVPVLAAGTLVLFCLSWLLAVKLYERREL